MKKPKKIPTPKVRIWLRVSRLNKNSLILKWASHLWLKQLSRPENQLLVTIACTTGCTSIISLSEDCQKLIYSLQLNGINYFPKLTTQKCLHSTQSTFSRLHSAKSLRSVAMMTSTKTTWNLSSTLKTGSATTKAPNCCHTIMKPLTMGTWRVSLLATCWRWRKLMTASSLGRRETSNLTSRLLSSTSRTLLSTSKRDLQRIGSTKWWWTHTAHNATTIWCQNYTWSRWSNRRRIKSSQQLYTWLSKRASSALWQQKQ